MSNGNCFDFGFDFECLYIVVVSYLDYFLDMVIFFIIGVEDSKIFEECFFLKFCLKELILDIIVMNELIVMENIFYDFDDDCIIQ